MDLMLEMLMGLAGGSCAILRAGSQQACVQGKVRPWHAAAMAQPESNFPVDVNQPPLCVWHFIAVSSRFSFHIL